MENIHVDRQLDEISTKKRQRRISSIHVHRSDFTGCGSIFCYFLFPPSMLFFSLFFSMTFCEKKEDRSQRKGGEKDPNSNTHNQETITSTRTNKQKEETIRWGWSRRIHLQSGEIRPKQERNDEKGARRDARKKIQRVIKRKTARVDRYLQWLVRIVQPDV